MQSDGNGPHEPESYSDPPLFSFQNLLFDRLKWPLTGRLEDIEVFDLVNDKVEWRRLFDSSTAEPHPILREPVTTAELTVIKAGIDNVVNFDSYHDDVQPEMLVVEEEDGSPVTVGTFIKAFHRYVNVEGIKEMVFEASGYDVDEDTDVKFWYYMVLIGSGREAGDEDEDVDEARTAFVCILLLDESPRHGDTPSTMESVWDQKISNVRESESERLQAHDGS